MVVGVVSARYNSADGWLEHSVWVARSEDLRPLLEGVAPIELAARLRLEDPVHVTTGFDRPNLSFAVVPCRTKTDKHRRIARWTLPLWLYVSVTGVIVYLMLYQM